MFEKVKELLVKELQIQGDLITMDAELTSDLGINSIELADLVMICEEQFDLVIEDEDHTIDHSIRTAIINHNGAIPGKNWSKSSGQIFANTKEGIVYKFVFYVTFLKRFNCICFIFKNNLFPLTLFTRKKV